mmetsp:Transcript_99905/g.278188  ORF Transcript_99905/g.278188 Transcript_99905/m.278188 type:complete len:201 (+) Transcript_99905:63-665(+)
MLDPGGGQTHHAAVAGRSRHQARQCGAREPRTWPRRLRCTKAASFSRTDNASLRPLISASRRSFRFSYVSGLATHRSWSFPLYSMTAASSVLALSLLPESSVRLLASWLISWVLCSTSFSLRVFEILFSWETFSYSLWASASSVSSLARLVAKSSSTTSRMPMMLAPAPVAFVCFTGSAGCCAMASVLTPSWSIEAASAA